MITLKNTYYPDYVFTLTTEMEKAYLEITSENTTFYKKYEIPSDLAFGLEPDLISFVWDRAEEIKEEFKNQEIQMKTLVIEKEEMERLNYIEDLVKEDLKLTKYFIGICIFLILYFVIEIIEILFFK